MRLLKLLFGIFTIFKAPYCYSQEILNGCHQLLVVTNSDWQEKQGNLQLYERLNDDSVWIPIGVPVPVVLGRAGLAWGIGLHPAANELFLCKKEGDGKSPAGIFSLSRAFGFASSTEMSHLKVEYFQLNQHIEAVDDPLSNYYNCIVDNREVVPDWHSSEKMGEEPLYEIGMIVDHNFPNPQAGAGSAIFLHIWRHENSGTAGCTAMSQENLNNILSWLDKSRNPVLVQLPISQYNQFQNAWNLPILQKDQMQPLLNSLKSEF